VTPLRALALGALLLASACTAPPQTSTPPPKTLADQATFLLANPAGLTLLDDSCRALGKLVDLPAQSAPAYPAMHPSRKSIAFGITLLAAKKSGFGSDIYTVNLDGTGMRPLVEHEGENVFYASPRFDPTGNVLYFHRRAAIVTASGQYLGNEDSVERVDLRTGERKRLLKDAADPDISPDGRTIVFVHVVDGQLDPTGLWIAGIDGSDPHKLFGRDSFYYVQTPRFAPRGDAIVFSGAGHTVTRVSRTPKLAHLSVPSELFLTGLASPALRSVTQTVDDVAPAWSADGSRLAYVGTGAFFVVTMADQSVKTCAQGQDFFFGDVLWLR
jgi:Tol biopolymer transport system component